MLWYDGGTFQAVGWPHARVPPAGISLTRHSTMNQLTVRRRLVLLLALVLTMLVLWAPGVLHAQSPSGSAASAVPAGATTPLFWYLLAAASALLVPIGLVLIGVTGLEPDRAWHAALGAIGAIGLAGLAYWGVGF